MTTTTTQDPEELVCDFHLRPSLQVPGQTMEVRLTPANPLLCQRKNATGNVQVPIPAEQRKHYEMQRAIDKYSGIIHQLANLQNSLAKIDLEQVGFLMKRAIEQDVEMLEALLEDYINTRNALTKRLKALVDEVRCEQS